MSLNQDLASVARKESLLQRKNFLERVQTVSITTLETDFHNSVLSAMRGGSDTLDGKRHAGHELEEIAQDLAAIDAAEARIKAAAIATAEAAAKPAKK